MATKVIDALIVTLGLDSSNYQKGTKEATKQLGITRNAVVKSSNDMSKAVGSAARSFALAFLGFSTSSGLVRMLTGLNETSRQLGLIAKNTGQNVQDLRNYANAFAVAGGSANGFLDALQAIQREQTNIRTGRDSAWLPFMRFLGVGITETGNDGIVRARDKLQVLKELADGFANIAKNDRPFANSLGLQMGFDQDTLNVLLQGSAAISAMVAQQTQLAQNADTLSEAAARLRAQWTFLKQRTESLAGVLLEKLQPQINKVFDSLDKYLTANSTQMIDGITKSVDSLAQSFASLFGWIDKIRSFQDSLPQWMKNIGNVNSGSQSPTLKRWDERLSKIFDGFTRDGAQGGLSEIPGTWQNNRAKYIGTIQNAESGIGIPGLLEKIINKESHWRSDIISGQTRSDAGAVGIAQLMPQFFPNAGKDANADIQTAASFLQQLYKQFGNWEDAVAAYNAGPATLNAVKAGRGGLPTETADYVNSLFGAGAANRVAQRAGTGTVFAGPGTAGPSTTIGTINLYPPAGTSESMRRDLVRAIERKGLVNQADYGVRP